MSSHYQLIILFADSLIPDVFLTNIYLYIFIYTNTIDTYIVIIYCLDYYYQLFSPECYLNCFNV